MQQPSDNAFDLRTQNSEREPNRLRQARGSMLIHFQTPTASVPDGSVRFFTEVRTLLDICLDLYRCQTNAPDDARLSKT